MKVVVLRVGHGRASSPTGSWADAACADYHRRLARGLVLSEQLLEPAPFHGDVEAVRSAEATRILATLREGDRLVAVDERGQSPTTEAFAGWIHEASSGSARRLVFALGGPYGHGAAVRTAAWRVLSLSSLVLNHEIARVVLFEQLYRAGTLLWGGAYHH